MAETPASPALSDQGVDYRALKAWIAAREAYEAATSQPAPLTPAQRKAIADLSSSSPSPLTPNIDLGNKDWISILQYYQNASQGAGTTITYLGPISTSSTAPAWTQTLTLVLTPSSAPLTFPSRKTGGLTHSLDVAVGNRPSPLPTFSRKKDAKKYAAKTCVEWLVTHGHLIADSHPSSGGGGAAVHSSSSSSSTSGSSGHGFSLPSPGGGSGGTSASSRKSRKGVALSGPGSSIDPRDDTVPATQRVAELCRRLGFQAPAYRLYTAAAAGGTAGSGLWDGEADFGRDACRVPGRIAVEKVYGRGTAREVLAERVLEFLLGVEEDRRRTARALEEEDEDDSDESDESDE